MENLARLRDYFGHDPRTDQILRAIELEDLPRIQITGCVGAMDSFVLSAIQAKSDCCHLVIKNDKEAAAYTLNNLENILQKQVVHFLPDSFRNPLNFESIQRANVLQRTETINKVFFYPRGQIIVTYPEAIFESVVSPEVLREARIEITANEKLDLDFLIEILVEYGFERVDFVYEPGQFSIRGGIIDIFSYGNEWPYRVELFDEDVESLRLFDPSSQLSKKSVQKVSIVPDIHKKFDREQRVSLTQVLPENSVVWLEDFNFLLDQLMKCFDKTKSFAESLTATDREKIDSTDTSTFLYPADVIKDIERLPMIFSGQGRHEQFAVTAEVVYDGRPQPEFNKNFTLLIDNLGKNEEIGLENFIFSDNAKQIERFYHIFEDLETSVLIHPIKTSIHQGFIEPQLKVACYTDHQIFQRFHRYRLKKGFTKEQALNAQMLRELKPGDFVTHIDHGVGRYSGLEKITIKDHTQESVRLIYKNNDILYVSINSLHKISKYVGREGTAPKLDKIGGDAWKALKRKTKKKVKDIAKELIKLYARRKASRGHQFPPDGYLQNELEASFIYEDTPDQYQATVDVKNDMQAPHPMDRLICGDVGFGKTEVAIRAAFKSVLDGKQVAVLVPTTILALQHFRTFKERLDEFGVTIDYLNRFRSSKERTQIFKRIESGEIEIVIGTHALLNKALKFKDLGLLIIDEEQKFGVSSKEKLRNLKVNVDTLTLTATPIPRTLQFSLMAARDLSIIRTPPPNRQPIHTERRIFSDDLIKEAIYYEINRGGQVFFVHNRVRTLPDITALLRRLCPDVDIVMAHGQMEPKTLERTLIDFIDGKYDVLVSTNIIETGLDIPNANTMIINNAHHFGLSDLHQLRGRVGRSNKRAFCYLFSPPLSVLTAEARKRLRTIEEFSDLGSGFDIAMRDLDIRGAGNLLGAEQSGFISEIGYETYQKILDEAIHELKEREFKELFAQDLEKRRDYVRDVIVETDIEMLIPDDFINQVQVRLNLYSELDNLSSESELCDFQHRLADRFGKIPPEVLELFEGLRLRWICKEMGFERLVLKNDKLRGYFVGDPQSRFYESEVFKNLMQYIASSGGLEGWVLKQSKKYLILSRDKVRSLQEAKGLLSHLKDAISVTENIES